MFIGHFGIGKYLRDVEKNKISKGSDFEDWDSYGGFFHFGLPQFDGRIASLKGMVVKV